MYLSSPPFGRELRSEHIITVLALVWDGGVIPRAAIPLSEDDKVALKTEIEGICESVDRRKIAPYLRLGFRLLGLQYLSIEQTPQFLAVPFAVYLESIMDDHFEAFLWENVLGRLPVAHYEEAFQIVDKILQAVGVDDVSHTQFEVPLAMLRSLSRNPETIPSAAVPPVPPRINREPSKNVTHEARPPQPPAAVQGGVKRHSRWEGRVGSPMLIKH
jgi:hypothetical protein